MQTFSSDYFCRYYMLFFEKFIKDIPNIPLSHLAKWRKFKNLISQNPPIQSLHNFLIKIFECESTLSLEQMETKFLEKPKKLTIEIDIEPNDEQDQTRKIISPLHKKSSPITGNSKQIRSNVSNEIDNEKFMELKTALVQPELIIKNFRSVTMDFGKGRLFNPFLEQKSTSKNETNAINSRKISEDEQEKSSPMILKVTKNEINHCEASKFKKLETKVFLPSFGGIYIYFRFLN